MSRYFETYSSNYVFSNGKVVKDEEEHYKIKNNKGKYTKKVFGEIVEERKLIRNEINDMLYPDYHIDEDTFEEAANILEDEFEEEEEEDEFVEEEEDQCNTIENKYEITNKNELKRKYRKKALRVHPDKCPTRECKEQMKELNNDYSFYNENC